jgi:hypothetical protein
MVVTAGLGLACADGHADRYGRGSSGRQIGALSAVANLLGVRMR